ncbi:MAG: hypothetical protein PHY94_05425, partial [Candidatus Omnitrophica bacterium]|nr:hypothetical protein [Candidatus Omnitrophota bacterium]
MVKNKLFCLFLGLAVIFLPGCVYLNHFEEVSLLKGLDTSQREMQAALNKEKELYDNLKFDLEKGRLKEQARKRKIVRLYGEPAV